MSATDAPRGPLVIGAGLMGRWHTHALRRLGIPVGGVVDPDPSLSRGLARRAGGCPSFVSLEEALGAGSFRSAHVCTPSATHAPIVQVALGAGLHLLVEKPVSGSAEETRRLLELAKERDRLLCPVHQFPFQDGFRRAQEWIPHMGRVIQVDALICTAGADGLDSARAERLLEEIIPHPLSMVSRLLSSPLESIDWHATLRTPGEVRILGHRSGTGIGIHISLGGRPTQNTLRVLSEGGTIYVDLFHGFAHRDTTPVSRTGKILRPFRVSSASALSAAGNLLVRAARRETAYPGLRALIAEFHDAIQSGRPSPIPSAETLDIAVVGERLLKTSGR